MATHVAEMTWRRSASERFTDNRYNRAHAWRSDGGAEVPGASVCGALKAVELLPVRTHRWRA